MTRRPSFVPCPLPGTLTMPTDVIMPNLGLTMEEGAVACWLAAPGERVVRGQPLFVVETDKVSVEVEALAAGVLGPLVVETGRRVAVGTVLARIYDLEEGRDTMDEDPDAGAQPSHVGAFAPSGQAPRLPISEPSLHPETDFQPRQTASRLFSSPRARKIARERGIDWRRAPGSGPRGRVVERDIVAAVVPASRAPHPTTGHLAARADMTRLLDAHRRLAPLLKELRLIDWLVYMLGVGLDEMQVTADLAAGFAGGPASSPLQKGAFAEAHASFTSAGDPPRVISTTARRSLARIASERSRSVPVPAVASEPNFLIHDLSASRIETFVPTLLPSEMACLVLGRIDTSGCATLSLSFDSTWLAASQAVRLVEMVIDLIEEPAGLLLAL